MTTEKFQKTLKMLEDNSLGFDLCHEDWDTLANVMLAYASKDETTTTKLKEVEMEFLVERQKITQQVKNLFES